ncbi:hypothetical protein Bca4012_004805 [Brassica carinata]
MASPQDDYIVFPDETNQSPETIPPLAVSTQHENAENSSLSYNAVPGAASPPSFKNLDLGYFSDHPLNTLEDHTALMEMCLKENNPEAHYIKGLKEYFHFGNTAKGLFHLRRNLEEGKRYMATLGWRDNKQQVDRCWRRIRSSLRHFDISMKKRYVRNMLLLKPSKRCHVNDLDTRCKRCFHYKQVLKFIDFI